VSHEIPWLFRHRRPFGGKYLAQIFGDSAVVLILFFLMISAGVTFASWVKNNIKKRKKKLHQHEHTKN
jgi:hypothetical protein